MKCIKLCAAAAFTEIFISIAAMCALSMAVYKITSDGLLINAGVLVICAFACFVGASIIKRTDNLKNILCGILAAAIYIMLLWTMNVLAECFGDSGFMQQGLTAEETSKLFNVCKIIVCVVAGTFGACR